jgi:fatty-acyl-CoA synthase
MNSAALHFNIQLTKINLGIICKSQMQLDPAYQPAQLLHALKKGEAKVLICAEGFNSNSYYQMVLTLIPELSDSPERGAAISSSQLPSLTTLIFMSNKQYRSVNIIHSLRL